MAEQQKPTFQLQHFNWKIAQNVWSPIEDILAPYGGGYAISEAGYDEQNADAFGVHEDKGGVTVRCYTRDTDESLHDDFVNDPQLPAATYPYLVQISISGEWYNIFVVELPSLINVLSQFTQIATSSALYEQNQNQNDQYDHDIDFLPDIELDDETTGKIAEIIEQQLFAEASQNNMVDYVRDLAANGEIGTAISEIDQIEDAPEMIKIALRAIAYHAADDYDMAIDIARQAITQFEANEDPNASEEIAGLLQVLGKIYDDAAQTDQAQECMERANTLYRSLLEQRPDDKELHLHIANTLIALGGIAITMSKTSPRPEEAWQRADQAFEEAFKMMDFSSSHSLMLKETAAEGRRIIAQLRSGEEYPE